MDIRNCIDCGEYKYIKKDGLCRDCYTNEKSISKTQNKFIDKFKSESRSNIPLNKFSYITNNNLILGSLNRSMNITAGIEMMRLKKKDKDLNLYCIDQSGILDKFISKLSGQIINLGKNSNPKQLNITDKNVCVDIRNIKSNVTKILPDLMKILSKNNSDRTVLYVNFGRYIDRNYKNRLSPILRHSRHYKTSINILSNKFPPRTILDNVPISRLHSIKDPKLAKDIQKITSIKKKKYITRRSTGYPITNNPDVLIKKPNSNKFERTQFSISKKEQKIIKSI